MRVLKQRRYQITLLALAVTLLVAPWSCSRLRPSRVNKDAFALVVGSNNSAGEHHLRFAVNDAKAIAKKLKEKGYEVVLLTDSPAANRQAHKSKAHHNQASAESVREQLRVISRMNAQRVVVYFSCVGCVDEGEAYLVPGNCQEHRTGELISECEVLASLESCNSPLKLAVLDSQSPQATQTAVPEGVALLRSAKPGSLSLELPEYKHGIFSYALLNAFTSDGDYDHDGCITLPELELYTKHFVSKLAAGRFKTSQMPQLRGNLAGLRPIVELSGADAQSAAQSHESTREVMIRPQTSLQMQLDPLLSR